MMDLLILSGTFDNHADDAIIPIGTGISDMRIPSDLR
jgi:hypothetical protein